jgi:hypothetical protein
MTDNNDKNVHSIILIIGCLLLGAHSVYRWCSPFPNHPDGPSRIEVLLFWAPVIVPVLAYIYLLMSFPKWIRSTRGTNYHNLLIVLFVLMIIALPAIWIIVGSLP